jgi:pyruvate dehydrogenase E1 component alpha subunit
MSMIPCLRAIRYRKSTAGGGTNVLTARDAGGRGALARPPRPVRIGFVRIETAAYQVLDPQGRLRDGAQPSLDPPQVLDALRWMMLSRAVDARGTALQRQGRLGTFGPVLGHEAALIGSAVALDPAVDWIVPYYRDLPALVHHGYPLERILARYMGRLAGSRIPDGVNVLPQQVAIAAHLPHAVGLAWGLRLQGRDAVVLAYFGEGATSEGDFHEACNLAGVRRAPVVFLLMNNQWAISTSGSAQTAGDLYKRAAGYGFEGRRVDGNDLLAVHEASREAVARARSGGGPTLIECMTYRLGFHNTTDNPREYLPEGWLEEAERHDPVTRVQAYLASLGLWDDATRAAVESEVAEQVEGAVQAALEMPLPSPKDIFDHVYAVLPPRLERQREEACRQGKWPS